MKDKKQHTVILIAGPTAVGKTGVGIEVARYFGAQIISADSRQCYREMSVGVARPTAAELASVPHHFVATHSIHQKVTAATFEAYALAKAATLFQQNDIVVVVGGTGLYINAFLEGLDDIPEVPEAVRKEVTDLYSSNGLVGLQARLQETDKRFWQTGDIHNPHRVMRALEVVLATGQSVLDFRRGGKKERPFSIIKTGLHLPKEKLHQNINQRVDAMMNEGLLEEVIALQPHRHLNALQTVGYKELFSFSDNACSLPQAVEAIKLHTRQYAKRQRTWFAKDDEIEWVAPDATALISLLETRLK